MSVFKRGNKWQYDFWIDGKRYRGSIPEARVKAQAERAETTIRDSVYEGTYGKRVNAPKLRDFIAETFMPWAKANKRTWVHDEFRSRPLIEAMGSKPDERNLDDTDREVQEGSSGVHNTTRDPTGSVDGQPRAGTTLEDFLVSD